MNRAQQPEVNELCKWFDEKGGFKQGTAAPHKWVLQANSEIHRLHARVQELEGQQKREPLTNEQIGAILDKRDDIAERADGGGWHVLPWSFARAIERAHGIE